MGKLYNRADLNAQTAYIDQQEQLANQRLGFAALKSAGYDRVKTLRRLKEIENSNKPLPIEDVIALEFLAIQTANSEREFNSERVKARMRLLCSGALIGDFAAAQASGFESRLTTMIRRVSWASRENALRRIMLESVGQTPGVDADERESDRGLNELEHWYYRDRSAQRWPFPGSAELYGSGYIGWLRWHHSDFHFEPGAFETEMARLRREGAQA